VPGAVYRGALAAKVARMAMSALFATLTAALAAVSVYAFASGTGAPHLLIGVAAGAVALWLASVARAAFRRRK
jgi:hypothetical protein